MFPVPEQRLTPPEPGVDECEECGDSRIHRNGLCRACWDELQYSLNENQEP